MTSGPLQPSRRSLLAALGLGTGSLFLPSLSRGQDGPPKRFLLMFSSQGSCPQTWRANPAGHPEGSDWWEDWTTWAPEDFSESLRPLAPYAAQCSAVSGLGLVSCAVDGSGFQHERSVAHGPTGANTVWVGGVPYTGAATIDQRIARDIARTDRFRSIECSVHGGLQYAGPGAAIYQGPGQPLPAIDDPAGLWGRLFGSSTGADAAGLRRQASVLDRAAERYTALAQSLSGEDRARLELHRDLVRDLESRLGGLSSATCGTVPEPPTAGSYEADFESHLQLIGAAFACDLTRVASIQLGQLTPEQVGLPTGDMHFQYAHGIYTERIAELAMTTYAQVHCGHLGRILDVLGSLPEGDGSVLDHTVVLWISELADSWHGMDQFAAVVAGGAHSGLQLGRYIHYAATSPVETPKPDPSPYMGVPHNRLLVTVCRAMGLDLDQLGVDAVRGWDGSWVDCTGALPELLA